ncbi:hypothetical protein DERP_006290 [Dermatophagoides pteronyssinus]|uniref:Uncharacterized protein n=1 Tax=Dermatophagoides pteronyssinus TaxID=6956 RepID=A0ABQ8IY17_DERPT|nr:hypothetical protein DERP_006290 [Dermatophagoides pteronyssinus]
MVIIRQDSSDDESSNEQQNRGRIPRRHRNGHANDQQNGPDLEENRGQIPWRHRNAAIPETHDSVDDLLEEEIINQYQRHNSRNIDVQRNKTQKLCTSTLYKQFT